MYRVSDAPSFLRGHRQLLRRRAGGPPVGRTVVLLGLTSLFTDVASEMVVTVLPLYLVFAGQFSPLAFGVVDGIQRGAAALVGLAGGFLGDRLRRHKPVAVAGYGLSAFVKLGLATAGTALSTVSALVLADRIGKGIRTAPRDAMISLSAPPGALGAAFGVHRALDTTGAMLGPLAAFAILALAPNAFESVFVVSFCVALVGLGILVLLVPARPAPPAPHGAGDAAGACDAQAVTGPRPAGDAGAPAREGAPGADRDALDAGPSAAAPPPDLRRALALLRVPRFRGLLAAGGALSLATASDAFVFLALQDRLDLSLTLFPLLFAGMAVVFMALAVPVGRLADGIGRGRVLLGGYALLLAVYGLLLAPLDGGLLVALALALMGAYYAATDGVLMAFGSALVPGELRGSGLALLGTTVNVARLLASVAFGALWAAAGIDIALAVFAAGLAAAIGLAALVLARTREHVAHA